jgi:hypothetical protein
MYLCTSYDDPYTQYSTNQHSPTHLGNSQTDGQCAVCEAQPEHVNITRINIKYKKVTYNKYEARNYPVSKKRNTGLSSPIYADGMNFRKQNELSQ